MPFNYESNGIETHFTQGLDTEGRWRVYDYSELIARDKACLDIFWLKDDSLAPGPYGYHWPTPTLTPTLFLL